MIRVFFDGASAGNPGPSGAGILVLLEDGTQRRYTVPLGSLSNHEAEFAALVQALQVCQEFKQQLVVLHTDSQLVDQAVHKRHVKKAAYHGYLQQALQLLDSYTMCFIKWVPAKENEAADQLAKQAIREQAI